MEVNPKIRLICTDKEQHKPFLLAVVEFDGEDVTVHSKGHKMAMPALMAKHKGFAKDGPDGAFTFKCGRCKRTPRINSRRLWTGVEKSAEVGIAQIDISVLKS